jgi:hypothetical protein
VEFSSYGECSFLKGVNEKLLAQGGDPIKGVGLIPGDWIQDSDLIVNAWDPHALIGNGCVKDNSFDGHVGRSSLVHWIHALRCMLYSEGISLDDFFPEAR